MAEQAIYRKNIEFLKIYYAGIFKQIQGRTRGETVKVTETKTPGKLCLIYRKATGGELPLYSKYDPDKEAALWADAQTEVAGKRHALVFGLGLGYHLEALLKLYPNLYFYVFEPDINLFVETLFERDWTEFPWDRVKTIGFEAGQGIYESFLGEVVNLIKEDWCFVSIPAFERCFSEQFGIFKNKLQGLKTQAVRFMNDQITFQQRWTVNAFKNLPDVLNVQSIFRYRKQFAGRTVILTASGPSLQGALPYLRKVKEDKRAIILSVGTSVNGLLRNGIKPDLSAAYDPFPENFAVLQPSLDQNVPLLFGSTIYHDVIKYHQGPKTFFLTSQDSVFPYLVGGVKGDEVISDAPSISVLVLQLLARLGVARVILVGQDCAYYKDQFYAPGVSTQHGTTSDYEKAMYVEITSNSGEKVFTTPIFDGIRTGLEKIIASGAFSEVINTSPNGAPLIGAAYVAWQELIDKLPAESVETPLVFLESDKYGTRNITRRTLAALAEMQEALADIITQINGFVALPLPENEKQQARMYNQIDKLLRQFTSRQDYVALIFPMVRNETYLLLKEATDIPRAPLAEKKVFVDRRVRLFIQTIQIAVATLLHAAREEWQ